MVHARNYLDLPENENVWVLSLENILKAAGKCKVGKEEGRENTR